MPSPAAEILGQCALAEPAMTHIVFPAPPRSDLNQQPRSTDLAARDVTMSASLGARLTIDPRKPAAATMGSLLGLAADKLGYRRDDMMFCYRGHFLDDDGTPANSGADVPSLEATWCLIPTPVLQSIAATHPGNSGAE